MSRALYNITPEDLLDTLLWATPAREVERTGKTTRILFPPSGQVVAMRLEWVTAGQADRYDVIHIFTITKAGIRNLIDTLDARDFGICWYRGLGEQHAPRPYDIPPGWPEKTTPARRRYLASRVRAFQAHAQRTIAHYLDAFDRE